ncbi:hypothetical protein A2961_01600 [Candidatus Woesebacteria bacterium RIFCSPLOWO2_01_FULL_39_21]|uniref:DUF2142 domain-containing protein n=1 Tax=Candidatus Woesebacteria bacterium RIFCSPLOWO2_01_FULL_39_21 TaxID=1802519 RepID=A0A1F8BMJ9_9BACT|nr:MAG: hypothetical protein A2691_00900 [Candidatus Woesebacteria bacterium RIFCSPHIGHO2_01_FULL_39_23]OGM65286.1 MAG: hypothetical protein A2961_01600 [Candidatus Woesebacteria bacterium RIFCSPLOWO2_01_FULL_39_21]
MKLEIHKVFLFVALAWGLITVFIIPPFEVMDEQRHYIRAGAIAEGVWGCVDGKLKISEKKISLIGYSELGRIAFHKDQKFDFSRILNYREPETSGLVSVNGLCNTFPLGHAIAAVGIKLGDTVNNQLLGFYLGRISNLLVSVLIVCLAIKTIPLAKKTVFFLGLIPTATLFYSSVGYDGLILSSSFLMSAYSIRLNCRRKEGISWKEIITFFIIASPLAFIKPVYLPIVLASLFLVYFKMGIKQKFFILISFLALVLGVIFYLTHIFTLSYQLERIEMDASLKEQYFLETESTVRNTSGYVYDTSFQVQRILSEPTHFFSSMLYSIIIFFDGYLLTMLGITGWGGYSLRLSVYALILFNAVILVGQDVGKIKLSKFLSPSLFYTVLVSFVLIFASMYIFDTPKNIEVPIVLGVQGRYFLPLLLPLFLALQSAAKRKFLWLETNKAKWLVVVIQALVILGTIESYIGRYYV